MNHETCPRCGSHRIRTKQTGRRSGAVIGLTAGAASGATGAMYGARAGGFIGRSVGMVAGPAGSAFGTVAGAILGALAGGTAGCVAGITVGKVIDDNLLGNRSCSECGHVFTASAETSYPSPQRDLFDAEEIDPHDPDYPHRPLPFHGYPGGPV